MTRYASNTSVSSGKSREEIEKTLSRYGADGFQYGWQGSRAQVCFLMDDRMIRFDLEMPDRNSEEFTLTPTRRHKRHPDDATKAWEQACRQRWRALLLVIKAKLEAVESGITTFETEFMPYTILPSGQTVAQWLLPQVETIYTTGKVPAGLLSAPGENP